MMQSLSVLNISKAYGIHQILNQVSFGLNDDQRIGLVGANGVGKSTLLKIIIGEIEADAGAVSIKPGAHIGYLAQVIADFEGKMIADLITAAMAKLYALEAQMRALESQMASAGGETLDTIMATYSEATEQFERYGGYDMDYRVDIVFAGLQIDHIPRERLFSTLSGGEKSRVGLAIMLLASHDILLLDEPTNHLDFASMQWLEGYLQTYRGAILIVSHDRHFLNQTVAAIIELDEHTRGAKHYSGNYDAFLLAKAHERRRWEEDFERQQEEIKELWQEIKVDARHVAKNFATKKVGNDKFAKGYFRGRTEIAVSRRVANARERLDRIEENPIPRPPEDLRFDPNFDPHKLAGQTPLYASNVNKCFGSRKVLNNITFTLGANSRIVLIGANGAGKSTLLKILAGIEYPDSGEVFVSSAVNAGYLDQEQETLDSAKTVFEAYAEGLEGHEQQLKSILLGSGLFRYEEIERRVGQMSRGQQRKLQIARLIGGRTNLLILDEPTNSISFDVLESFEEALRNFPGPIIAASHDRRFIERFNGEIWEMHDGSLIQNSQYVTA